MSLIVQEVRIRNFRSLKEINVKLSPLTLLVGTNNSGKTSFLKALELVFGIDRKQIRKEDFHATTGSLLEAEQNSTIDVLLTPIGLDGERVRTFDETWSNYWGATLIRTNENDFEHIPIRTTIKFDRLKRDFTVEQHILSNWEENPDRWDESTILDKIPPSKIEKIPLLYLDAQRDIQKEMRNPLSFWGKLISDINLDKDKLEDIETDLLRLNNEILNSSTILSHLQNNLNQLNQISHSQQNSVEITPVTRKIRDIYRGVDVLFSEPGADSFPLEYHGMGTRSWATLLAFRSYASWIEIANKEEELPFWCILALEEPESHLHPQAQRKILKQMASFNGQKIISTHSPYIASFAPLHSIRHFSKNNSQTIVSHINMTAMSKEDIRKINREVMSSRGELLFSKCIILCEGETEEQALPIFFEAYFGFNPFELGVNIVGVGGKGKRYLPFLHVATGLNINWLIFSDGEQDVLDELEEALLPLDTNLQDSRIIYFENHQNFEQYILTNYPVETKEAIIECDAINEHHKGALRAKELSNEDILKKLKNGKTKYAPVLAETIVSMPDINQRIPNKIKQLFQQIRFD
ncbi:ATP-dependent nuclease [Paenibacillus polymyxa]|uniref:ATP-dependent nuclease n=1 Tax=Paenibacillus polymyxa TaxID=1406 RepID=UPI00069C4A89|nr:AAA family ATPase [Paenibacillus polymyxa]